MSLSSNTVESYYDAQVARQLQGFVDGDARVECAWQTLIEWASSSPRRILEIGCGIGAVCWRLSRWAPQAEIVGLDISARSLEIARRLFAGQQVSFVRGPAASARELEGHFDLIMLMDVYEHISLPDRPSLHAALRNLRSEAGSIFLSFPTPRHLAWLRRFYPGEIQPVDLDITAETMLILSRDLDAELLLYQEVDVWNEGDYAHAVLGGVPAWPGPAPPNPGSPDKLRATLREWIGGTNTRRLREMRRALSHRAARGKAGLHRLLASEAIPSLPSRIDRLEMVRRRLGPEYYPE